MFGRLKRMAIGGLALTLAITPSLVSACGGFFGSSDLTIDLNAFRVAFSVGPDHTITEVVGVDYTGKATDFSWVMPLPATPTVSVAGQSSLDALQQNTDTTVSYPVDYCARMNELPLGLGGGDGGGEIGTVGPYDYAIIKNDNPGQLVKWLRDHGYKIKTNDEPIINQYVREGNTFVALRLKPGADVQDIQPVVFTYQSDKITIPVRMGAVASSANVPILAWIFGDSQYAPTNYKRVDRPSLTATRAVNEILNMAVLDKPRSMNPPDAVYAEGVSAIQAKYKGHAFITEFAGPTKDLGANIADPVLQGMLAKFPYVTRLHAQLSPDQMTLDPLFAPITGGVDVPSLIDLGKVVDPLKLFGCLSTEAITPEAANAFAISHTTFDALHFDVGHPTDWKLSEFGISARQADMSPTDYTYMIYVYSPQPVTAQTIDTYFKGGSAPPMFVFTELYYSDPLSLMGDIEHSQEINNRTTCSPYGSAAEWLMLQSLGRDTTKERIAPNGGSVPVSWSVWPYSQANGETLILYGLLASSSQWQANKSTFDNMMRYANAHQYFTGADTKDTLFLKVQTHTVNNNSSATMSITGDVYALPVPNGWTAQFDDKNDIVIAADQTRDNGPTMRLTLVGKTDNPYPDYPYGSSISVGSSENPYPADIVQRALSFYGLPGSPNDAAITALTQNCAIDPTAGVLKPVPFHTAGRTGLVAVTNEYIVGVYAPDADYSKYQATLQKMMDAYVTGYICGVVQPDSSDTGPIATPNANGTPVTCPKSPPPQLTISGAGQVTPGLPDNLRSAPNTSAGILLQIPAGGYFTVLNGPVCDPASGLAWWQVQYKSHKGWLAEGQGQTYFVKPISFG